MALGGKAAENDLDRRAQVPPGLSGDFFAKQPHAK
jgi:hypothetical protein